MTAVNIPDQKLRLTDPSEIKARLIGHGFTETGGCGRFSVMSKADPAPVLRRLCG